MDMTRWNRKREGTIQWVEQTKCRYETYHITAEYCTERLQTDEKAMTVDFFFCILFKHLKIHVIGQAFVWQFLPEFWKDSSSEWLIFWQFECVCVEMLVSILVVLDVFSLYFHVVIASTYWMDNLQVIHEFLRPPLIMHCQSPNHYPHQNEHHAGITRERERKKETTTKKNRGGRIKEIEDDTTKRMSCEIRSCVDFKSQIRSYISWSTHILF